MRNNKMKGFTLVELLVVIAILAILATVSVVGYTSFIESATVSNDENIAAQLNNFLVAMKADHTGKYYGEEIDENNIREVTDYILQDSGLEELVPQAEKYGYHFYYDLEEDKYVVMKDADVNMSAMNIILNAFADEGPTYEVKLENSFTQGNRYFFVGTPSETSPLSLIVDAFYKFDSANYTDLDEMVTDLANVGLTNYVKDLVVVTDECNYRLGSDPKYVLFIDGVQSIGTTTKQWNGAWETKTVDGLATITGTLTIPNSVKYMAGNSLNVGSAATIVFNKAAAELGNMAFQHFTDATIKTNDGTYHSGTCTCGNADHTDRDVIVSDADATVDVLLNFYNPASSFDMEVSEDVANKVLNNSAFAYVVYDKKTFDLNALNFVAGTYPELPSSTMNSDIVWSVENGSHAYVKSITDAGVVTLADTAPTTACDITFVGTTPEGVTLPFVVKVVAANGLAFSFDGVDMTTRDTISLFYGTAEGSDDTFSLTNVTVKYNYDESEIEGLDLADDVTFADYGTLFDADGYKLSVKSDTASGKLAIKVNVGEYYSKTITVDLMNVNALNFHEKNTNTPYVDGDRVLYVGDDNAVLLGDLFNKNADYPTGTQVWVMNAMPEADYSTMTGVTQSTLLTNAKIDLASNWDETAIQFTDNGDVAVVVVVAPDAEGTYYRISQPVLVNVVDGKNVRTYTDLSSSINNILLADLTMTSDSTFTLTGKTFFGNCFTFDIKAGKTSNVFGIITLNNANMQDTRVIGALYPSVGVAATDAYGSNAIHARGTTTISNCYIANCRAPLAIGHEDSESGTDNVTISNSVIFGGKYCNIEVRNGKLNFAGEKVITINQPHTSESDATNVALDNKTVGLGITVWLEATDDTAITGGDKLVQYNFIPETYTNLPVVSITYSGISVEISTLSLFQKIFSDETTYGDYHFGSYTKYVNASYLGTDLGGIADLVSKPSGDRTGFNEGANSPTDAYKYVKYPQKVSVKVNSFLTLPYYVYMHIYGLKNTETDLFTASTNAEYKYSPWNNTVNGTLYSEYDFVNGEIVQE